MSDKTSNRKIGSAFDLLGKSAEIVKNNWQVFAVVNIFAILSALDAAFNRQGGDINRSWTYQSLGPWESFSGWQLGSLIGIGALVALLLLVVSIFLATMTASLEVKSAAGKKPNLSELFEDGKKYFFRFIGVSIVSAVIILAGLILLIIPGIIALGRLVMAPFHLVDKDLSVMEAIKQSNNQATGRMSAVYGAIGVGILVSLLAGVVGIVPVIGPLVGAAIAIACSLVLVLRYQELKKA